MLRILFDDELFKDEPVIDEPSADDEAAAKIAAGVEAELNITPDDKQEEFASKDPRVLSKEFSASSLKLKDYYMRIWNLPNIREYLDDRNCPEY